MEKIEIKDNIIKPKYRDLKTEFLEIKDGFTGRPITLMLLDEINNRYYDLFHHFNLSDLQWRITNNENSIQFSPIRAIDHYAINGIINS